MTDESKLVSLRIPLDVLQALDQEAERRGTSRTDVILERIAPLEPPEPTTDPEGIPTAGALSNSLGMPALLCRWAIDERRLYQQDGHWDILPPAGSASRLKLEKLAREGRVRFQDEAKIGA
jgi:hypothetical protein